MEEQKEDIIRHTHPVETVHSAWLWSDSPRLEAKTGGPQTKIRGPQTKIRGPQSGGPQSGGPQSGGPQSGGP